jgi:hypothetical protein
MKNKSKCLHMAISLLLTIPSISFARIGESTEECDARYGKQKFKFSDGAFSSKTYLYKEKYVGVFFKNNISIYESISLGSSVAHGFYLSQAVEIDRDFISGFLGVYDFSDPEISSFIDDIGTDVDKLPARMDRKNIQFIYNILLSSDQTTLIRRIEVMSCVFSNNQKNKDELMDYSSKASKASKRSYLAEKADGF